MATNPRQAERELSDLGHETRKATDQAGRLFVPKKMRRGARPGRGLRHFGAMPKAPKKHSRAELKRGAALRNDRWTPSPCLRPPRTSPNSRAQPTLQAGGQ